MQISQRVRIEYEQLCSLSAAKCETLEEMDAKILRCVHLGQPVGKPENGIQVIQYFNNQFLVRDDTIIGMRKNLKYCVQVDRKAKEMYFDFYQNAGVTQ